MPLRALGRLGESAFRLTGGGERGLAKRWQQAERSSQAGDDRRRKWWLTPIEWARRNVRYLFNALDGHRPAESPRSGLILGPVTEAASRRLSKPIDAGKYAALAGRVW